MRWILAAAMTLAWASSGAAQPQTSAQIVAQHSSAVTFDDGRLSGPGAQKLLAAAVGAQFLIVLESHNDQVTPAVTSALFGALHTQEGFNYVAIEQDELGMEAASAPERRGSLDRIAEHARAYPYSYTFSTDEELRLLADAGAISTGRWNAIWGFDQLFGATMALQELEGLAAVGIQRAAVSRLLADARAMEARTDASGLRDQANNHFMTANEAQTLERLGAIRVLMAPATGSRADILLSALSNSAEIYSYYDPQPPRDEYGTPRGLLNNTVREELMKRSFMRNYRFAEAADSQMPKVVVKAGYFHMVRGLTGNNVFALGNFLHEFAISNGRHAVSVQVLPLREWWPTHESMEPEYRALLPSGAMDRATLVDLRPLRAHYHSGQRFGLEGDSARQFRQLIFGMDFALVMPSRPGTRSLTTMPSR